MTIITAIPEMLRTRHVQVCNVLDHIMVPRTTHVQMYNVREHIMAVFVSVAAVTECQITE